MFSRDLLMGWVMAGDVMCSSKRSSSMFNVPCTNLDPRTFISISHLTDCWVIGSVHSSNARHGLGMLLVFDIYMLCLFLHMFANFEGRQRLFDQMSEIELNWLWRFSFVVGVTTPRAQHNQHMYRL